LFFLTAWGFSQPSRDEDDRQQGGCQNDEQRQTHFIKETRGRQWSRPGYSAG
jgi:hypothetical protein